MMFYALMVLAAAAVQPGDLYFDDAGCKWVRAPVPVAKPPAKAASRPASAPVAPAKPKPRRPSYAKPAAPQDEFIGCEPEGPPPTTVTTLFPPEEAPPVTTIDIETFERLVYVPPPESPVLPPTEETFSGPPSYPPIWGPPIYVSTGPFYTPVVITPVPEWPIAYLFALGLLGINWKRRHASRGER